MKKNQSMIDMTQGSPVALTGIAAFGLWGIWWSVGIVWAMSGLAAWMRYMVVKKKYFI
ncbi:MAG: hypothetical protein IKX20_06500 [Paludibacteraceae bacterium]|nr:hypothetical protein [Paludibacteraceae bacterium]